VKIDANLRKYLGQRQPSTRSSSFDYCFNYFQSYREAGDISGMFRRENMDLSCLHLGFYLASMGTTWLRRSRMFIDPAINPTTALQRSAMCAAMNMRDRLRFAPMERGESFWRLPFYKHYVPPTGRGICLEKSRQKEKQQLEGLLCRRSIENCPA